MYGHVDPTREAFDEFKKLPRDTVIMMLNLICLKDDVTYPGGEVVTGQEAYRRYGETSLPIFKKVGGEVIWRGKPEAVLTGPAEEHWDIAFIARYPNAGAFFAMIKDPDYAHAVVHRQMAVKDSRLIRMGQAAGGAGFAG